LSLSDIAAVVSVVSGVAIVFSLIFLALQIRQSNRNQKSLMQQGRTARTVGILLKMSDPYVGEIIAEAQINCAAMEPAKIWAFYGFAAAIFWTYEDSFLQLQANTLDDCSWESDATTIRRLLAYPVYRTVWRMARDGMGGAYREWVDSVMAEVKSDSSLTLTDLWITYATEELAAAQHA
jgi:hypothetical protein